MTAALGRAIRNSHLWLPGYLEWRFSAREPVHTVWLAIADHFEPLWARAGDDTARERAAAWRREWPRIAQRHCDSAGCPPRYTFFYPEEEYRPHLLEPLAEMAHAGIASVEVHIHHDGEGEANFVDRMSRFLGFLQDRHGLLRKDNGQTRFGFIHGNWALDNSLPDGRSCGLNNEITLLHGLGCYADFTLPSAPSAAQTRTVNTIYWAKDDPLRPRSHERGVPVTAGGAVEGDLMIIPGPLCLNWREAGRPWRPRTENGEIARNAPPSDHRVRLWLHAAPRLAGHAFVKLFTHGAQEKNAELLLGGGLDQLFDAVRRTCDARGLKLRFASAYEMWSAIEALRTGRQCGDGVGANGG